jgi:hypothetical protein
MTYILLRVSITSILNLDINFDKSLHIILCFVIFLRDILALLITKYI